MAWYVGSETENRGIELLEAELERASDRAAAILAGSLVETRLTAFLKNSIQDDGKIWKNRTHSSGPLGSFSMKIDLAFMMKLITKDAHSDLVIMKDIRNEFAHLLDVEGFQTQSIKARCMNLKLVDQIMIDTSLELSSPEATASFTSVTDSEREHGFFRIGGPQVKQELLDARMRFIWSARVYVMALGTARKKGPQI